jgi:hypothetical protein
MSQHQKIQTKFSDTETLVKNYNFQLGEIIEGELIFPQILPLVLKGEPDTILLNNPPVKIRGKVNEVNDAGEVVSFILSIEINPPSSAPTHLRPPTLINLDKMISYSIFLVE